MTEYAIVMKTMVGCVRAEDMMTERLRNEKGSENIYGDYEGLELQTIHVSARYEAK